MSDWLSLCWIANEMVCLMRSFGKRFRQESGLKGGGRAVVVVPGSGGCEGVLGCLVGCCLARFG